MQVTRLYITRLHERNIDEMRGEARCFSQRFSWRRSNKAALNLLLLVTGLNGYLTGAINADSVLKVLTSGENRALGELRKGRRPKPCPFPSGLILTRLGMKKSQAWVDVRKLFRRSCKKKYNMAAPVLLIFFSAQTHNNSLRPSPRPDQLPGP